MKGISMSFRGLVIGGVIASLSGCAAITTSISKRNLDVQTKVSTAIFVDPVKRSNRLVYVDIRSSVMEFDRRKLRAAVKAELDSNENGYRLTDDPDQAQYMMNIFVVSLEKASPTAAEQALKQGYVGDTRAAAAAGAIYGAQHGGSATSMMGGGILAAAGTTAVNAFVQDVTFMLVADVQVKEKARKGVIVRKDSKISTKISDAGSSTQTMSEVSNLKEYRTRIVTTAEKANLDIAEAEPLMFKKTAYAMAGFF